MNPASFSCVSEVYSKSGERLKVDVHGNRVIAASRRPDGTLRKEIKIRPGYIREEDVEKFKSKGAEFKERVEAQSSVPVGYTPLVLESVTRKKKKNKKPKPVSVQEIEEVEVEVFEPGVTSLLNR